MTFLENIIDSHKGERFLVCGTGPSIDQYPREWYERWPGITIGVNGITELFTPHYYVNIHEEPHIITDNLHGDKIRYSYRNPSTDVDVEKTGKLSIVGTVAAVALAAAYMLGASEISLIGIDMKATEERHHFRGCTSAFHAGGTHFIEKEDELKATIRLFERAFAAYQRQGVKIFNLSKESLLLVA